MNIKRKFLIVFSLLILTCSLSGIGSSLLEDYHLKMQQKELTQLTGNRETAKASLESMPDDRSKEQHETAILPAYEELYEKNPDMVGWLKIDGTQIDYPVMQNRQEEEYYLSHGFDKRENKNGLPFLDGRCRIQGSDILLIHGHNMKSGLIFGELTRYKKESFYQDHPTFRFDTLYETSEYEIVAVILSKVHLKSEDVFKYYQFEKIETPDEYDSYISNIKKLALYDTGVSAEYGDELIILSTCEYSTDNGRLAVVARKMQ